MVASGKGNKQKYYSSVDSVFSKAKPQKKKLTISKISWTFQAPVIQKPKIKLQ